MVHPNRPNWDLYFMQMARAISARATCNRAQVGAVVVDEHNMILITGYNGAPPGFPHCPDNESMIPGDHCSLSLHAEQNILSHASRRGTKLEGATWYLWPFGPCERCQLMMIGTRPHRVVYAVGVASADPELQKQYARTEMLRTAGIRVIVIPGQFL